MDSPVSDAERLILKVGDRVFIVRTSFPEGTRPPDFTQETLRRIASHAINTLGVTLSSLPSGSSLSLESMPLRNYDDEKSRSSNGQRVL